MDLSIVIPAYNEAKTIRGVVLGLDEELRKTGALFEIIAVDNGSSDETSHVLEDMAGECSSLVPMRVFPNRGYGNGILAGLAAARGKAIGWMHADFQVRPRDAARVYKKLQEENLDFCKATRTVRKEHPIRIIQSRIYNNLFRAMFQAPCSDINGTPKIFRRWLYEKDKLQSKDWFIDPEVVIKAIRHGAIMGEVPITWEAREGGSSNVRVTTGLEFIKNMIEYRFFKK